MDTVRQRKLSFKVGFFSKLAKEGVLPSALFERTKQASPEMLAALPGFLYGEGKQLALGLGSQVVPAAKLIGTVGTLAPLGIGAATGTLAAKLNAPPEPDMAAIRKEELISLYRRLTDEVRARRMPKEAEEATATAVNRIAKLEEAAKSRMQPLLSRAVGSVKKHPYVAAGAGAAAVGTGLGIGLGVRARRKKKKSKDKDKD